MQEEHGRLAEKLKAAEQSSDAHVQQLAQDLHDSQSKSQEAEVELSAFCNYSAEFGVETACIRFCILKDTSQAPNCLHQLKIHKLRGPNKALEAMAAPSKQFPSLGYQAIWLRAIFVPALFHEQAVCKEW